MTEPSDRLRRARLRRGFDTGAAAADAHGWSRNTYASNENGNAKFSFKMAERYAVAFGVRAEWLLRGTGPMVDQTPKRPARVIPLLSWVSAGHITAPLIDGEAEMIEMPGLGTGEYFATMVRGDSMDRISPDGSMIVVKASDKELRSGGFYLFSIRGEATFKRYFAEPVKRLEPYSTNPANRTIFLDGDEDWEPVGRVVRSWIDLD